MMLSGFILGVGMGIVFTLLTMVILLGAVELRRQGKQLEKSEKSDLLREVLM